MSSDNNSSVTVESTAREPVFPVGTKKQVNPSFSKFIVVCGSKVFSYTRSQPTNDGVIIRYMLGMFYK